MAVKNDIYGIGILIMKMLLNKSVKYSGKDILQNNPNEVEKGPKENLILEMINEIKDKLLK
jgi:hypothetical protein